MYVAGFVIPVLLANPSGDCQSDMAEHPSR